MIGEWFGSDFVCEPTGRSLFCKRRGFLFLPEMIRSSIFLPSPLSWAP